MRRREKMKKVKGLSGGFPVLQCMTEILRGISAMLPGRRKTKVCSAHRLNWTLEQSRLRRCKFVTTQRWRKTYTTSRLKRKPLKVIPLFQ
jgi:hypothetical protein